MTLPKHIIGMTVTDEAGNIDNIYVHGDRIIVHYGNPATIATTDDVADTSVHTIRIGTTSTIIELESTGRNVVGKVHLSATAFELIVVPAITEEPIVEYDFRG